MLECGWGDRGCVAFYSFCFFIGLLNFVLMSTVPLFRLLKQGDCCVCFYVFHCFICLWYL